VKSRYQQGYNAGLKRAAKIAKTQNPDVEYHAINQTIASVVRDVEKQIILAIEAEIKE